MKTKMMILALIISLSAWVVMAQPQQQREEQQGGKEPPPQAYTDCQGKKAGDTVQHATRGGKVAATCESTPQGLVARPNQPHGNQPDDLQQSSPSRGGQSRNNAQQYSIEQAISDQAQLHTIAFNGLAFITGDYGAATFISPGKVCDFFGFQYMRDIDVAQKGHNPIFLNRVAGNVLYTLNDGQRALLEKASREEARQM